MYSSAANEPKNIGSVMEKFLANANLLQTNPRVKGDRAWCVLKLFKGNYNVLVIQLILLIFNCY